MKSDDEIQTVEQVSKLEVDETIDKEVINSQGVQGESLLRPEIKVHGLNQFSFGQISPRFYEDKPSANLLEEPATKDRNRDYIKVREYGEIACEEARLPLKSGKKARPNEFTSQDSNDTEGWDTTFKQTAGSKSKTPCFIKSPNRSLASSRHFTKDFFA